MDASFVNLNKKNGKTKRSARCEKNVPADLKFKMTPNELCKLESLTLARLADVNVINII